MTDVIAPLRMPVPVNGSKLLQLVAAIERLIKRGPVEQVALDYLEVEPAQVPDVAAGAHHGLHLLAVRLKRPDNSRTDYASGSGDQSLHDINFDFDSFVIRSDAREILKINADYLSKHRVSSVVIEGHCDERGTAEYNMALGERRAQETKKYLVNLGVRESMFKTVSFGSERPLDFSSDEEAWAKNRRAHFAVTP